MFRIISTGDLFKLLSWLPPYEDHQAFRDSLLIHLWCHSLRKIEAVELCTENVRPEGNRIWLEFRGKGDKKRIVPISSRLHNRLQRWQSAHPTADGHLITTVRRPWAKVHQCRAWMICRERTEKILGYPVRPHILRHTCATFWLRSGVNIRVVQVLLGHSNITTTAIYLHASQEDLIAAVSLLDFPGTSLNLEFFPQAFPPGTPPGRNRTES